MIKLISFYFKYTSKRWGTVILRSLSFAIILSAFILVGYVVKRTQPFNVNIVNTFFHNSVYLYIFSDSFGLVFIVPLVVFLLYGIYNSYLLYYSSYKDRSTLTIVAKGYKRSQVQLSKIWVMLINVVILVAILFGAMVIAKIITMLAFKQTGFWSDLIISLVLFLGSLVICAFISIFSAFIFSYFNSIFSVIIILLFWLALPATSFLIQSKTAYPPEMNSILSKIDSSPLVTYYSSGGKLTQQKLIDSDDLLKYKKSSYNKFKYLDLWNHLTQINHLFINKYLPPKPSSKKDLTIFTPQTLKIPFIYDQKKTKKFLLQPYLVDVNGIENQYYKQFILKNQANWAKDVFSKFISLNWANILVGQRLSTQTLPQKDKIEHSNDNLLKILPTTFNLSKMDINYFIKLANFINMRPDIDYSKYKILVIPTTNQILIIKKDWHGKQIWVNFHDQGWKLNAPNWPSKTSNYFVISIEKYIHRSKKATFSDLGIIKSWRQEKDNVSETISHIRQEIWQSRIKANIFNALNYFYKHKKNKSIKAVDWVKISQVSTTSFVEKINYNKKISTTKFVPFINNYYIFIFWIPFIFILILGIFFSIKYKNI